MSEWKKVKLGEICDILNGYAFKSEKYVDSGYRIVRITNVQKGKVVDHDQKFYPFGFENIIDKYILQDGDLLISLTGNVGRVGIINKELLPAVLNQRVACIRVKSKNVNKKYIFSFLNSDYFENICINNSNGIAQKNLSTEWLKEYEIQIPPLGLQEKIANILNKSYDLINLRLKQLEELDNLIQSIFYDMFGDPLINKKGWEVKRIGDFSNVRIGPFGSMLHVKDYIEGGYPIVNPSHIINEIIIPDRGVTINEEKLNELQHYVLKKNDIVVGRRGDIGRCAVVENDGYLCGTGCMFIRIHKDYLPIILQKIISSESIRKILENQSVGVTMKNLNSETIYNLEVPIIPIELQYKFMYYVKKIELQKSLAQQSLEQLEFNYKNLMQRAFNGTLFN